MTSLSSVVPRLEPFIPSFFQFKGEFRPTTLDYLPIYQDMDVIGFNMLENSAVVGDN